VISTSGVGLREQSMRQLASIVVLTPADPLVGRVLCDNLVAIFHDELRLDVGALSVATMNQVAVGLRFALSI
jgi:mRNA interferase MazF